MAKLFSLLTERHTIVVESSHRGFFGSKFVKCMREWCTQVLYEFLRADRGGGGKSGIAIERMKFKLSRKLLKTNLR